MCWDLIYGMEEIKPKDPEWKKYEKEIHNNLKSKFPDCEISYDDSVFRLFSNLSQNLNLNHI